MHPSSTFPHSDEVKDQLHFRIPVVYPQQITLRKYHAFEKWFCRFPWRIIWWDSIGLGIGTLRRFKV